MSQATMRQIAGQAGVSLATVSYVLNASAGVQIAPQTRQRVLDVANELGYHDALLGRSIKRPLRHIGVAVAAPDPTEQTYTSELFAGIREQTLSAGYYPVLQPMPSHVDRSDGSDALRRMTDLHRSKLIDGFIVDKAPFLTAPIVELFDRGVPLVLVNSTPNVRSASGRRLTIVNVDNRLGGRLGAAHLLECGHRRIGLIIPYVGGDPRTPNAHRVGAIIDGYNDALAEAGVAGDGALIIEGDLADRDKTERAVHQLMQLSPRPTAMFVADDTMAVMAIHALRKLGLSVPADVSVIGYGDWPIVQRLSEPPLTTIHTPLRENGRLAATLLIDALEGRGAHEAPAAVRPTLVVRDSTAAPSPGRANL